MLGSLAEILILGLIVDWAFRKLTIPGLVGMLLLGVAFGPYALAWLSPDLLSVSQDFRLIALVVILLRAGFELSKDTLNRVGGRVLLLSAVPAIIEGAAITVIGPPLLGLGYFESAILGSVLAAVSPAVVVPLMIRFMERRMGAEKGIPTMVLAASSIDDVFVIVIYSVLVGIYTGNSLNLAWQLAGIPISIVLGTAVGLLIGLILFHLFRRFNPRATKRVLVLLGLSVLLVRAEHVLQAWVPFAALLAVMAIGFLILEKDEHMAHEISAKLGKIWVFAEIVLFTIVGAQVNLTVAVQAGLAGAALIGLGLVARSVGTYACLLGSDLNPGERLFVVISYLPKATVQAAIGGAPLAAMSLAGMDTGPGEIILAVAVLSILLTAPLGAWAIAVVGERTLTVAPPAIHDAQDAVIESHGREQPF
jgi:solute carrier family 9B (sodium/hydrogen exchanger), member 1/2